MKIYFGLEDNKGFFVRVENNKGKIVEEVIKFKKPNETEKEFETKYYKAIKKMLEKYGKQIEKYDFHKKWLEMIKKDFGFNF